MNIDWDFHWTIQKEDLDGRILDVVRVERNGLTTVGKSQILDMILGNGITDFGSDPYLGVGDGSTAFDPAQTDLQGADKTYESCDTASNEGTDILWSSLFGGVIGGRLWREFAIFDGPFIDGTNFLTQFAFGVSQGAPSDPTGGTWTLTSPNFGGPMGGLLPFDITAAQLQTALETFLGAPGYVQVTALDDDFGYFNIELTGIYGEGGLGSHPWLDWSLDTSGLTGPDAPYDPYIATGDSGSDPVVPMMLNRRVANLGNQPSFQNWRLNARANLVG